MKRRICFFAGLLLLQGIALGANDPVVLAIPARHNLVDLAFDVYAMFPRRLHLVCYAGTGENMTLERFDAAAVRWVKLVPATWTTAAADRLVLVGEGESVRQLQSLAPWAVHATVVSGQRLHEVANAVNDFLEMSPAQWRRLAKKHQFTLVERNAEERRYGRYGPPGRQRQQREVQPAERQRIVLDPVATEPLLTTDQTAVAVPADETAVSAEKEEHAVVTPAAPVPAEELVLPENK